MATVKATIKKKTGTTWDEIRPKTEVAQIVDFAANVPSTLNNLTDVDLTTTAPSSGDALVYNGSLWVPGEGGGSIDLPDDHFLFRKIDSEVEAVTNATQAYILLCRNAGGNDVNGTITMDRTSGLRHASFVDILISAGSSLAPVGTMRSMSTAGGGTPTYKLVTLTYNTLSYIALSIYNPDSYYDTSGMYFTGRIKTTDATNEFLMLPASSVSDVADFGIFESHQINGDTIWHAGNLTPSNYVAKAGDTMTGDLTIAKNNAVLIFKDTSTPDNNNLAAWISFKDQNNSEKGWMGYGYTTDTNMTFSNTIGNINLTPSSNVGIGTTSPAAKLQVAGTGTGEFAGIFGADVTGGGLTNSTRKFARIGMPHYTNSQAPFSLITGDSDGTNNTVYIGGGTSSGNAATQIRFATAGDTVTAAGTDRVIIDSSGKVGIGTASPTGKLTVFGETHHYDSAGVKYMNSDPRWAGDTGRLHIWATTAAGATYGSAGLALWDGDSYHTIDSIGNKILIDGNEAWHAGNLTNLNQLTNGPGYITSFDITTQTDSKYLRSDTADTATQINSPIFSGNIATSGDGQSNYPFRLTSDYSSYMVATAGNTWGLFWAGNSGARYGTNGNGGPGNIWGNSGNPNEFAFVGSDSTAWSVQGSNGDTWQKGGSYLNGGLYLQRGGTEFSNYIRAQNYPSKGYSGVSDKYWIEYGAKGGHHFVVDTDGGTGGGTNSFDNFTVWKGAVDGPALLQVNNGGDTYIAGNLDVAGSIYDNDANLLRIIKPKGGTYSGGSSVTGAIGITLPAGTRGSTAMMSMVVDVYDYAGGSDGESWTIQLGGYNYTGSSWYNIFANLVSGRSDRFFNVKFSHDAGSNTETIWIGENTSNWSYPQIQVRDVVIGHSGDQDADWHNNAFNVTIGTIIGSVTLTKTAENYASDSLKLQGYNPVESAAANSIAKRNGDGDLTVTDLIANGVVTAGGNKLAWVKTQGTTLQSGVNFTLTNGVLYISTTL